MGYIGDYVHYRAENYQKFGIFQTSKKEGINVKQDFFKSYREAKQDLLSRVQFSSFKGNITELEEAFNDKKKALQNLNDNSAEKEGLEYLSRVLDEKFKKRTDLLNADFKNLEAIVQQERMRYNKNNIERYMEKTMKRFANHITNFEEALTNAERLGEINKSQFDQISTSLKTIKKEFDNLQNKSWTDKRQHKLSKAKNMFQSFNDLIKSLQPPTLQEYGDIGEISAAYIMLLLNGKSEMEASKLIEQELISPTQKILTGKQGYITEMSKLSGRYIDTAELSKSWGSVWTLSAGKKENQIMTTITPSNQTIDINVSWNEHDVLGSVKNVRTKYNVHIAQGIPLTSLFNLVNTDFVNHYLNILALHYKPSSNLAGSLNFGTEIMEKALILRGFAGARGNRDKQANVLIINDRSTGKTHLLDISLILKTLLNLNKQQLSNYINVSPVLPKRVNNEWKGSYSPMIPSAGGAKTRITSIINELHSYKMSLTLKKFPPTV